MTKKSVVAAVFEKFESSSVKTDNLMSILTLPVISAENGGIYSLNATITTDNDETGDLASVLITCSGSTYGKKNYGNGSPTSYSIFPSRVGPLGKQSPTDMEIRNTAEEVIDYLKNKWKLTPPLSIEISYTENGKSVVSKTSVIKSLK